MLSAASIFAKGLGVSTAELDPPAPAARNPDTIQPWVYPWCRLQPTHIQEGRLLLSFILTGFYLHHTSAASKYSF